MPRYLVERTFSGGTEVPLNLTGAQAYRSVADNNSKENVSWVHSYVTPDRRASFCILDAPSPEAIRYVAAANNLPIDRITEVRVLSPYFYL